MSEELVFLPTMTDRQKYERQHMESLEARVAELKQQQEQQLAENRRIRLRSSIIDVVADKHFDFANQRARLDFCAIVADHVTNHGLSNQNLNEVVEAFASARPTYFAKATPTHEEASSSDKQVRFDMDSIDSYSTAAQLDAFQRAIAEALPETHKHRGKRY